MNIISWVAQLKQSYEFPVTDAMRDKFKGIWTQKINGWMPKTWCEDGELFR